jgi:basic membrane lipoprotein Med (substrate-binding protein (PBP1-ABC) superfamily)
MRLLALAAISLLSLSLPAADVGVTLLTAGSVNDGGWNQLAKEGLTRLAASGSIRPTVVQKIAADQAATEIRAAAADGNQLVIAHGYEYLNPASEVAKTLTGTRIVVSGADVERPGIVTIDFDVSQASYQLGVIAGTLSKSGKLGFIGGGPFPSVKACYRGFIAGAKSVRPDVTVAEAYTSWDQVAQNKAQAEAFIAQGIDQIYPDVDAAAKGIYEAVKEHNARNPAAPVWTYGCVGDANANPAAGAYTLASAVIRLDNAFAHVVKMVADNTWKPGVLRENLATGTCVTVLNPKLTGTVLTADLQALVAKAGADLVSGAITIP